MKPVTEAVRMEDVGNELAIHPMSAASPELEDADITALQASIAKVGQRVPIVVYRGEILDGRKRFRACRALEIEPLIDVIPDDASPEEHVTALNLLRTHYTPTQRSLYASKITTLSQGENLSIWRKNRSHSADTPIGASTPPRLNAAEAGALVGVSRDAVLRAKKLRRIASPAVVEAVERGDLNIRTGTKIAKSVAKADQPAAVAQAMKLAKGKSKRMPVGTYKAPSAFKALPKRDTAKVITKSLANIEGTCDVLVDYAARPLNGADRSEWIATINGILTTLKRVKRQLEKRDGHEG